MPLQSYITIK